MHQTKAPGITHSLQVHQVTADLMLVLRTHSVSVWYPPLWDLSSAYCMHTECSPPAGRKRARWSLLANI